MKPSEATIVALLILGWSAVTLLQRADVWTPDLMALYMAGHFVAQGAGDLMYAAPDHFFGREQAPAWNAALARLGEADRQVFPFVYPPLWGHLMAWPSAQLSPRRFILVAQAIQIVGLALCTLLTWRIVRPARIGAPIWVAVSLGLLTLSVPAQIGLDYGNPQLLITFLTILAVERWSNGAGRTAGIVLAIAAGIKILPAVFVVLFLIDRNLRAVAAFAGTLALLVASGLLWLGPEIHLVFLDRLAQVASVSVLAEINLSLGAALIGLFGERLGAVHLASSAHSEIWSTPASVAMAMKLLFVAAMAMIVGLGVRLTHRTRAILLPVMISIATGLTAPLAWVHYFLPLTLMLPALAVFLPPRTTVLIAALFVAGQSQPVSIALANIAYGKNHMALFYTVGLTVGFFALAWLAAARGRIESENRARRSRIGAQSPLHRMDHPL